MTKFTSFVTFPLKFFSGTAVFWNVIYYRWHHWKGIHISYTSFKQLREASTHNFVIFPITECFHSFLIIKKLEICGKNCLNVWTMSRLNVWSGDKNNFNSFLMHLFFWRTCNFEWICKVWLVLKEVGTVACSFFVGKPRV